MSVAANPINLAVRFCLELVAWGAYGVWGWNIVGGGFLGIVLGIVLFVLAATAWGLFAVPNDSVRSGKAPVLVSGKVRLLIELVIFAGAVLALYAAGFTVAALVLAGVLIVQNLASYDRLGWLIRN